MRRDNEEFNPRRLYRDTSRGVFAGVIAGIARYFDFGVCAARFLTILACLFFGPFVLFMYIIAALVLKPLPLPQESYERKYEEVFWKEVRRSPKATFSAVRYRMWQLERSLQRMEHYVTSPRFKLDRDFRKLENER